MGPAAALDRQLASTRFTGYALIYDGRVPRGAQLFLMGKVLGLSLDSLTGAAAQAAWGPLSNELQLEARRATRPQVLSALAAAAGTIGARLERPSAAQVAEVRSGLLGFSGLVAWLRSQGEVTAVYGYHDGLALDSELPGQVQGDVLLQLLSPQQGQAEALSVAPVSAPPLSAPFSPADSGLTAQVPPIQPVAAPPSPADDVERLWQAALMALTSELGTSGVAAANKMRAAVGDQTPQEQRAAVRQRLSGMLGAKAVALFDQHLGL